MAAPGDLAVLLLLALPLNKLYWDVGIRIRPWYLIAPLALVVSARRVLRAHPVPRPLRVVAMGYWLILVAGLASGLWSIDRSAWLNNAGDLLLGVTAALAVALAGIGPGRAQRLVTWWIVVGVGMSAYGLLQYGFHRLGIDLDAHTVERVSIGLRRSGIDIYASYPRINSLIEDSSNYSVYLLTVWPLLIFRCLWGDGPRSRRALNLGALGLVTANLALTLSRSGIVGGLVGLGLAAVLVPAVAEADRRRQVSARRTLSVRPARMAVASTGLALVLAFVGRSALTRIVDLRTQNSEGTQIHISTLVDSVQLMAAEPWGVGLGGFPRWYQIHRAPWEPVQTSTFNSFTDAGTSAGALALLGYVVILGSLGHRLLRSSFERSSGRADAAGALMALVAVSVAAFFYPVFATGYFVGFVGLLVAIACAPSELDRG